MLILPNESPQSSRTADIREGTRSHEIKTAPTCIAARRRQGTAASSARRSKAKQVAGDSTASCSRAAHAAAASRACELQGKGCKAFYQAVL